MNHRRILALSGLAVSLSIGAAACGSSASSGSSAANPAASPSSSMSSSAAPSSAAMSDFGPGCAAVPKSGAGSFTGMSAAPVAAAASSNPVLSTLVQAVEKAGLVDTLNSASGITVFAPDNYRVAKIPSGTLTKVLADKAERRSSSPTTSWPAATPRPSSPRGSPMKTLEGGTVRRP